MKKLFCVLISIMLIFSLGMCLFACDNSGGGNTSSSGLGDSSLSSGDSSSSNGGDSSSFDNSSSSSSSSGNDSSTVSPVDDYEFELIGPSGEVYPYAEDYKAYLMAEGDVNVASYCGKNTEAYSAVVIEWKNTSKNLQSYIVEYGTKADFSDATSHELSPAAKKLRLYSLYKATTYYVRVTANYKDGSSESADGSFSTTDNGPRTMKIDGIYNVRDMGGYVTASGKRTVQGRFFRGGALSPSTFAAYNHVSLSDNGKKYMSETLGIKTNFFIQTMPYGINEDGSPSGAIFNSRDRVPSYEDIRMQEYALAAFGYDGISLFCYGTPGIGFEFAESQQAMIDRNGEKTDIYTSVSKANAEILAFDHVLAQFDWVGTFTNDAGQTNTDKSRTSNSSFKLLQRMSLNGIPSLKSVTTSADTLFGYFNDIDGNDGIMVVNYNETSLKLTDKVELNFDETKYNKALCYIAGKKTVVNLKNGKFELELGIGEGVFVIPYAE